MKKLMLLLLIIHGKKKVSYIHVFGYRGSGEGQGILLDITFKIK